MFADGIVDAGFNILYGRHGNADHAYRRTPFLFNLPIADGILDAALFSIL